MFVFICIQLSLDSRGRVTVFVSVSACSATEPLFLQTATLELLDTPSNQSTHRLASLEPVPQTSSVGNVDPVQHDTSDSEEDSSIGSLPDFEDSDSLPDLVDVDPDTEDLVEELSHLHFGSESSDHVIVDYFTAHHTNVDEGSSIEYNYTNNE